MKKYLPIIILIVLLFGLSSSALAYPTIVQDYPLLKACENNTECKPGQTGFGLPQYIKYIFIFALGTVGIIGLLAIIMAAFDYVKSVGNPQKAAAGKDKITSALLGLLLLLASYVLLNLVNPDLLKLKIKEAPVKVIIPPGGETGCRFLAASWNKDVINAGESADLTISWDAESCQGKILEEVDLPIKHEAPGDTDHTCWKIEVNMLNNRFPNNSPFSYNYTFNKKCHPTPSVKPACMGGNLIICNYNEKNEEDELGEEMFYLEGTIKIKGQSKLHVPRLKIDVRDLDNDGNCCR